MPTCAHLGLLPQRVVTLDGFRAQGRTKAEAAVIVSAARQRFAAAGRAVMLLLEAVPDEVTREIVAGTSVPVLGCARRIWAHGHVIVLHDLLATTPSCRGLRRSLATWPGPAAYRGGKIRGRRARPGVSCVARHEYRMKNE